MVIDVNNVTVEYILGDFKDAGLKDVVIRKLRGQYQVRKFNALSGITAPEPRRTLHHYYTILFILVSIATQQCDLITVQNK